MPPDLNHPQPATPILVPPTYMPVVSTYPPQETFAPGPSTILPIYPEEIGQNVKAPGTLKSKPGGEYKTTQEPITQPAIQSTIGAYEGEEEGGEKEATEEWSTVGGQTSLKTTVKGKDFVRVINF